ncbi:hypothetical protein SKAU_G00293290 [Synaphobranchus kaupii]|uniref:Major facilitator superfamily associated domain-containing protein n=1 Tax=Synaphobranchus kaupii TaxID=118154 RepID=A0A9Q1EU75_SYNKA|nr:hypothetical protein SKAU_G00293290 [Synaphobranchus kaupii]
MKRNDGQWDVKAASAHAGLFHFLYFCGRACLLPFLTLYLRYLGLTAAMTGITMATRCLVTLAWGPVSTLLAKRYDRRRTVVIGSLLCSAGVALLLLLVPPADVDAAGRRCNTSRPWVSAGTNGDIGPVVDLGRPGNVTPPAGSPTRSWPLSLRPGGNSTATSTSVSKAPVRASNRTEGSPQVSEGPHRPVSSSNSGEKQVPFSGGKSSHSTSLPERGVRSAVRGSKQRLEEEEEEAARYEFLGSLKVMDPQHQLFFLVLMGVALWEGLAAPSERTVDDWLYEYLDFVDAADRHGSARVWGILGASGGAFGVGLLVGGLNCMIGARLPSSAVHFFAYALLMALTVPAAAFLPMYLSRKREPVGQALKALRLVRADPCAMLSAATAFLAGAASSAVSDFLLWQMQDHGSGELHMGLALSTALLSQVIFLILVAPRTTRFLSHGTAMAVGAASLGLQCLYYSFLWSPWSVLPAQALSCLSAGALWRAVEGQCGGVATPGTERWVRGVVRELAAGLGAGLGSLASGFTVERFGVAVLFRGASAVLLLWGLCLPVILSRLPRRRRINYSRLLAAEASEQSESESEPEQESDWLVKAMQEDKSTTKNNNRH